MRIRSQLAFSRRISVRPGGQEYRFLFVQAPLPEFTTKGCQGHLPVKGILPISPLLANWFN